MVFSLSVVDSMNPDNLALELESSSLEIFSQSSGKNFFAILSSRNTQILNYFGEEKINSHVSFPNPAW
jgi:hypothetical protein